MFDDIYVWLKLVQRATNMRSASFETWKFMVGTGGTLTERIELGKRALAALGVKWDLQIMQSKGEASDE